MRIAIDARSILNPEKNPQIGVGHYTYQLIRNLLKIDQRNRYTLFFDYRVREKDVKKFSAPNVTIKYFPWSDYKKYLPGVYSEILGLATLGSGDFDLLHTTSPDGRVPIGYQGKVICTFQDLAVYKQQELFPALTRIKARYNRQAMAKRADRIIAVSENTKNDLIKILKVEADRIEVVNNAIDERFFVEKSFVRHEIENELKDKFRIDGEYILFVGTLEPIKNLVRLLQAFKVFKDKINEKYPGKKYQLVLGGKPGWLVQHLLQVAKDLGIANDLKFLGYVEGDDLKKLFFLSSAFVMPSLYEGFGMTVLEALASRAVVAASNIETIKEIAGETVEYFDPLDVRAMAEKIEFLVSLSDEEKNRKVEKGLIQAKKYSWQKCAEKTLEVYQKVARKS